MLSIIIPVYNNCQYTKRALTDLSKLEIDNEIIIVDNGSTDDTEKIVSEFNVVYIKNLENRGFSYANNQGFDVAKGEYVLFLNNDIKVLANEKDWPNMLIKFCADGIVGTQTGQIDSDYNFVGEGNLNPNVSGRYLSGWCLLSKKETWNKLVENDLLWDSKSFFLYFEDGDLSFRAKKKNIPLYLMEIPLYHYSRVTGRKYNMFYYFKLSQRIFKKKWPKIV